MPCKLWARIVDGKWQMKHQRNYNRANMKPMIKYRGGKSKEIKFFEDYIPADYNRYIEPFVGGGAVFFYLEPSTAIINDLNTRLIQFYNGVKNNYTIMRKELDVLSKIYAENQSEYEALKNQTDSYIENKNETLYYNLRDMYNGKVRGEFSNETLYFFINKTAYSGMIRFNSNGEYNVPFGRYRTFNSNVITDKHNELLKRTEIYNQDYAEIFNKTNSDDFIFLDPPYDCVFTDYGNTVQNTDFSEDNHRKLAQDFKNLCSKTLLVIGKTKLTETLYKPYIKKEYPKSYAVNIRNRFKSESMHLVISNFNK